MRGLLRFARSPRVAVSLIFALSAYIGAVTLIPQASLLPEEHARWALGDSPFVSFATTLGLDHAYTNPIFIVLAAALSFSTAVCAWERTRRALGLWRNRGRVTDSVVRALEHGADVTYHASSRDAAEEAVARVLATRRMRVRRGSSVWFAESGAFGLLGSPVFHWALVALVVATVAGQLTRWEGLLGVVEGAPTLESEQSYRVLDSGPLAIAHTGWELELRSVQEDMTIGDVFYGVTPRIAVSRGGQLLAEQDVYPNNPLRVGPLLVHASDHGLSARVEVRDGDGQSRGVSDLILDFDDASPSGTVASTFDVSDRASRLASVSVEVDARDANGGLPHLLPPDARATVTVMHDVGRTEVVRLAPGEFVELADGWRLVVRDIGYYARLSVVRDWSVLWIYGILTLACVGVSVALAVPYRVAWVRFTEDEATGVSVAVCVRQYRRDPVFRDALVRDLTVGTTAEESA